MAFAPAGQRTLQHSGDVLDTQIVVNPAHSFVCSEVRDGTLDVTSIKSLRSLPGRLTAACVSVRPQVRRLVCSPSRHKLLVLAGQCLEVSGDIVLQQGSFSFNDFIHIFADEEVSSKIQTAALISPSLEVCPPP